MDSFNIQNATFIKSSVNLKGCPPPEKPEFAFIGRSNVGKSSLINMITDRKNLAKTSSKPGKTRHINHFEIDEKWYLVDLPGYGWAKVSKAQKAEWGPMIENYLLRRDTLMCVFVLVDARLEPQAIDYNFLEWLGKHQVPFAIVFTKTDKLSQNKLFNTMKLHEKVLKKSWAELPEYFLSSIITKRGRDEILKYIEEILGSAAR
jgi:GTP-binding protein